MKVCLDACVLFPTVLREILLAVAERGLYAPQWSPRILEEWARATVKLGPGAEDIARGEIALLTATWPKACVTPRDRDLTRLHLPDENDVHVLAAAIAGNADLIVTFNAKDFPRHILAQEGLIRQDPDQFLRALMADHPEKVRASIDQVHKRAQTLAGEPLDLKSLMKRARLPRLAKSL